MIATKYLFGLILVLAATGFAPSAAQADDPPLGAYNADISESSISGISSGAFMAVQFATAWSDIVKGVGIIAGGPYCCAQATAVGGLTGDIGTILTTTRRCMVGPPPALEPLGKQTDDWARTEDIDDTRHIAGQKIYVFGGYNRRQGEPHGHRYNPSFLFALSVRPKQGQSFLSNRDRCWPLPGNPDLRSRVLG